MDKGEKETNLAHSQEFGIRKQQISDRRKNKEKILKFTDSIETSEGLKRKSLKLADDEQMDKALYAWFIQQRSTGTPSLVSCREKSAPGFKKAKDCLNVLGCTNATGTHKLKPVLIGKCAKPMFMLTWMRFP